MTDNPFTHLFQEHYEDLKKSGLSDEIILEEGIKSACPRDIDKIFGYPTFAKSAYEIPYLGTDYSRYKMFYDEADKINPKTGDERPKYLAKTGSGNRLYIPHKTRPFLKDLSTPFYLTEGEKKALKATQEGIPCIAISGLWNWKVKDQDGLIPDFDRIALGGRTVYLVPDNDFQKPDSKGRPRNLEQAVLDLGYLLLERGAKVSWIELPSSETKKIGLDDYLYEHTSEEFLQLPKHEILGLEEALDRATPEIASEDLKELQRRISKIKSASERDRLINTFRDKTGISKRAIDQDVKQSLKAKERRQLEEDTDFSAYFFDEAWYLCRWKSTRDGDKYYPQRLCNFDARITEEITEDNGIDVAHSYTLEGRIKDTVLQKIEVPASQFSTLNWLYKWGNQVVVEPGQTVKDYVRHATQVRSKNAKALKYYTHTGWREINGQWAYLSGGGALGADNVSVKLSRELQRYCLPHKPENEPEAINASLSFLGVGRREITLPLWSLLYLSALTTFLEPMPNFSGYLYAETGNFKTTLAILLNAHFGDFRSITGLSNFSDTANSLEKRAFLLKDTLMVIDDYHPDNRKIDAQQKENLAQRLIRAYSNRTGRGRLNSDATDKGRYEPRGMLLITGEEMVTLQSTLARLMVIEYSKDDIDKDKLTELQKRTDLLPHAMSSFILWIKERFHEIQSTFKERFIELRNDAFKDNAHKKLPEQVAFLQFGLETVLSWIVGKGVMSEEEASKISEEGWSIFMELSMKQTQRIEQDDPVRRFAEIVQTLVTQKTVRLEHRLVEDKGKILGGEAGELVGYFDDAYLYFLPQALWHSLQRYCIAEGTHFPFTKRTLYNILRRRDLIMINGDENVISERMQGEKKRVLKLTVGSMLNFDVPNVPNVACNS